MHLVLAGPQQHVVRLDVTVHDADRVGVRQGGRDLRGEVECAVDAREAVARDPRCEVPTGHVLGREVEDAVVLAVAVDLDDVRAVAAREDGRLPEEAGAELRLLGELDGQHLERDPSPEALLDGLEHDTHAAGAQLPGEPVGTEGVADTGDARHPQSVVTFAVLRDGVAGIGR